MCWYLNRVGMQSGRQAVSSNKSPMHGGVGSHSTAITVIYYGGSAKSGKLKSACLPAYTASLIASFSTILASRVAGRS